MTDEIKQDALTEEIKSDGDVKTGKVFSEEEVQKLIRERVQREKDVNKRLVEDATSEKATLESTIVKYESILSKQIEAKASALPEEFKVLFDKLTLAEKIEYLEKYPEKETKESTPFPKTPVPNGAGDIKKSKQNFRI
jgi:hypothetical protein